MNKKKNNVNGKVEGMAHHGKIALIIAILCFSIGVVTAIPQQPYTLYGTATLNGKVLTAQDNAVISLEVDGVELVSYTMGDISGTDNYVLKVPMDSDSSVTTAAQEGDTAYIYVNGIAINEGAQIIGAPSTTVQFDISVTSESNPPSSPTLNDPGTTDTDGDYTVRWGSVRGATSYTLEEDTSSSFSSPTVVYSGAGTSKEITDKSDGTYCYRVKACNAEGCSGWSNVEDVVVSISHGEEGWKKTFGGPDNDAAYSLQKTSDGGYILAGYTESYGAGSSDFWLLKTDSCGKEQWNETFGGAGYDIARSVQQTSDGGFILAGCTKSHGAGSYDAWVVRIDSNGDILWHAALGGTGWDEVYSVQETTDGSFILAGYTDSYGAGLDDAWLVKIDANGNIQWEKTFGGSGWDKVKSVRQTSDGGFIIAGLTGPNGVDLADVWLVKTDANGNKQWDKTFGGDSWDSAESVQQISDGGFILAGYTLSNSAGGSDFWLMKTDSSGNKQWDKTFGGTDDDYAYSVHETTDGGFILAGCTTPQSNNSLMLAWRHGLIWCWWL